MTDRIHVQPAHLRQAAAHHQQTADYLRTVPSSHDAIRESLDSLGPIFSELRDTGRELLELRKQCYQQQADKPRRYCPEPANVGRDVGAARASGVAQPRQHH